MRLEERLDLRLRYAIFEMQIALRIRDGNAMGI
jgi:hypothetical protein